MPQSNQRCVFLDENGVAFRTGIEPQTRPGEVPVRVQLAGICETDLQLVQGYMGFNGILGHEFVGLAESGVYAGQRVVGEINCSCRKCDLCQSGMANHCPHRSVIGILNHDGAFADIVFVPPENLHPVPADIPDNRAIFTEPLAAAFQITRQIDVSCHPKSIVVGDGRLAYLIAQVLRLYDTEVTVVGKHPNKLVAFEELGIGTVELDAARPWREFSLAVDCTGSVTGIPTALKFLKPRGTLILKTTVSDPHGPGLAQIVIDEINLIGSRCGPFGMALEALQGPKLETDSLITARFPIEKAVEAFETARLPEHRKVLLEL